jgi:hypothetical protein
VADIFLLYRHDNAERASLFARAFEQHRWSVWWDQTALAGNWRAAIDAELESAKCVVLLWSQAATTSQVILHDAVGALKKGRLVLVRIDHAPIPPQLATLQAVDLARWRGANPDERLQQLFEAIASRIDRPSVIGGDVVGGFGDIVVTHLFGPSSPPGPDAKPAGTQPSTTAPSGTKLPGRAPQPPSTLFICYRREDTEDAAGRLKDRLAEAYSAERVFMDIDSVPLGIDFVDHVTEQISKCSAVIVMIGKQWLTIKDKKRRRRLDNPDDLVRVEIAAALKQNVPVIPVVVQNAPMPAGDDLPEDIRLLARRNGIKLPPEQWREGVERLLRELDPVMGRRSGS